MTDQSLEIPFKSVQKMTVHGREPIILDSLVHHRIYIVPYFFRSSKNCLFQGSLAKDFAVELMGIASSKSKTGSSEVHFMSIIA